MYRPEGQVYSVDLCSEDLAAVACGSRTHRQTLAGNRVAPGSASKGFAMDASVSGNRIYVAESAGGLSIWEKAGVTSTNLWAVTRYGETDSAGRDT